MKQISLDKRFLYYILLLLISSPGIGLSYLSALVHNFNFIFFLIFAYLIPQYIFGLIFLKTKKIFKLIVPLITSIVSFGCVFLMAEAILNIIDSEVVVMFFPIIFVWEIAYQILVRSLNKKNVSY